MIVGVSIVGAAVLVALIVGLIGWRRVLFTPFTIRPSRMTVRRLGLRVDHPQDVERVNRILESFAAGFNAMITVRSESHGRAIAEDSPPLYRPFTEEGIAMGYTLRHLFLYRPEQFEQRLVMRLPEFRYLYYVGLGFWSGMRNHDPSRLGRISRGLDPLYGYLCYDGYGFKHAFFDYGEKPNAFRRLEELTGYAKNAAYQGVGRAFYFRFMSRPELLIGRVRSLGVYAVDAAAGVGLAAAFVNPDRLARAQELGEALPVEWREHYHLGMCFGLKARAVNNLEFFERVIGALPRATQDAVYASIRECDRVELLVRADGEPDSYRRWRERVTDWLTRNLIFPMSGVKSSARASYSPVMVSKA